MSTCDLLQLLKSWQLALAKKPLVERRMALISVESEGFEPSSKQRIFKASTCLVFD